MITVGVSKCLGEVYPSLSRNRPNPIGVLRLSCEVGIADHMIIRERFLTFQSLEQAHAHLIELIGWANLLWDGTTRSTVQKEYDDFIAAHPTRIGPRGLCVNCPAP